MRIARLQGWRQLEPPQSGAPFPYELAFQEISSKRFVTQGEMHKGEKYKLYLVADPARLRRLEAGDGVPRRKVQVFVIDSDGRGQPVFPSLAQGSVENEFPVLRPGETKAPEKRISLEFPAASSARTTRTLSPPLRLTFRVNRAPWRGTTTPLTVTMDPGSAVPETTMRPSVTLVGIESTAKEGAVVSRVTFAQARASFPAGSTA